MFKQDPWMGIGWNNFQRDYNLAQARYFERSQYTEKEFLLADNTFYAFNDYWQFVVETGVFGGFVLISFIIFIIIIIRKHLREYNNPSMLFLIPILITVSVSAIFTHVFENIFFQATTSFIILYLISFNNIIKWEKWVRITAVTALFAISTSWVYAEKIALSYSYIKLDEARVLANSGYLSESKRIYESLYPNLKTKIIFLKEYTELLTSKHEQKKKLQVLNDLLKVYTGNSSVLKVGIIYRDLGMSTSALKLNQRNHYLTVRGLMRKNRDGIEQRRVRQNYILM